VVGANECRKARRKMTVKRRTTRRNRPIARVTIRRRRRKGSEKRVTRRKEPQLEDDLNIERK
jgi:hypothetical protein